MKFPRFFFAVGAVSILALTLSGCGGSSSQSQIKITPPPPPTGTNYTTCTDNAGNDQLVPNWQSSKFQTPYQAAISALIQHVSTASYAGQIGYIRVGLGKGGEINLPQGWDDSSSGACYDGYSTAWGYTVGGSSANSSSWNSYLAGMVNYEGSLGSPKKLLVSITPITGSGTSTDDFIAGVAVTNNIAFGNQGLEASDITNFPACGGDWCNLFAEYPNSSPRELQTIGQSCPQGVGQCSAQQQSETGPLPPLLSFATGQGSSPVTVPANDLELYYEDWLIAYDPNDPNNAAYGASYASAIEAAAGSATMQVLFPDPTNQDIATYVIPQASVSGVVLDVDWSDIQPTSSGSFDWGITDSAIQQWIGAGASKVNLVFQNTTYGGNSCPSSGIGSNGQSDSGNCAMPTWMWTVLQ